MVLTHGYELYERSGGRKGGGGGQETMGHLCWGNWKSLSRGCGVV